MPIVYKTVTYAIDIDLAEEGLDADASDDDILNAADAYADAFWDHVETETFVEAVDSGLVGIDDDDGGDDGDDFDFDLDSDFEVDDDGPELPETPDDSDEY